MCRQSALVRASAHVPRRLARVVIGGLLASTLITLVLIPALYISVSRFGAWADAKTSALWRRMARRGRSSGGESGERARA